MPGQINWLFDPVWQPVLCYYNNSNILWHILWPYYGSVPLGSEVSLISHVTEVSLENQVTGS